MGMLLFSGTLINYACWIVLSVCMYVCLSHFVNPYILQLKNFTDILIKYKIFKWKNKNVLFHIFFFKKSSLFIYKSRFFLEFHIISAKIYILRINLKDIKSFKLKNTFVFVYKFFQKLSLFLYKSRFSTILLNICQDIHFTGILMKYEIFLIKKYEFLNLNLFKSRLCSYINIIFLQFLFYICQKIHFERSSFCNIPFLTTQKTQTQ